MYSILLVDDEYLELKTLTDYVDWESRGFFVCGTAKNGSEALTCVKQLMPDVVLTDIRMPVMDGTKLANLIHQRYPKIKIVFLSGYDEFEYAKAAIKVEAAGYLLKPLDMEELDEMLVKVKAKCDWDFRMKQTSCTIAAEFLEEHFLHSEGKEEPQKIEQGLLLLNEALHISTNNRTYFYSLITIDESLYLANYAPDKDMLLDKLKKNLRDKLRRWQMVWLKEDFRYFIISPYSLLMHKTELTTDPLLAKWVSLFALTDPASFKNLSLLRQNLNAVRTAIVPQYGPGLCIPCTYSIAVDGSLQLITDHQTNPIPSTPPVSVLGSSKSTVEKVLSAKEILGILRENNKQSLYDYITAYMEWHTSSSTVSKSGSMKQLIPCLTELIDTAALLTSQELQRIRLLSALAVIETRSLAKELVLEFLSNIGDTLTAPSKDSREIIINEVKALLQTQYSSHTSIESIAEQVYLSPNYLSSLFKEQTGQTVLEYLTGIRLKKAAKLLKQTPLRINDISQKVGYENPSYFCAIFQKKYGSTPGQFRTKAKVSV